MNATPLFSAFVGTCLLSLTEPIYEDARNLKVEYPPSAGSSLPRQTL